MRLTLFATAAVSSAVALMGFAGAAQASATIDLIWIDISDPSCTDDGRRDCPQLGTTTSSVAVTDNITLAVILTAGPKWSIGAGVSVNYGNALPEFSVVQFQSLTTLAYLPLNIGTTTDQPPYINNINAVIDLNFGLGLPPGQSAYLGTVTFHKDSVSNQVFEIIVGTDGPGQTDAVLDGNGGDISTTTTFNSAFLVPPGFPTPTPTPPPPPGSVVGWGDDFYGQASPPDTVNGILGTATDITAGGGHNCAIQAGAHNVVCWGADFYGQTTPPDTVNGILGTADDIAAGGNHSCAIQASTGNVVCWGRDEYGQATPPETVNGISGTATDIAARNYHTCAIQAGTGNVVCWGRDNWGQATPPNGVTGKPGTASDIAAGWWHSCAIQAGTGNVVCWGHDGAGSGQASPPDAVNGVSGTAAEIMLGRHHSCAIQAGTGNVVCWGADQFGQSAPPDTVNGISGTASDVAGDNHTLAIVPEPSALTALGSGIAMLALLYRRRRYSVER